MRVIKTNELKLVSGGAAPGGQSAGTGARSTSPASTPTPQTPAQTCASVGLVVGSITFPGNSSSITAITGGSIGTTSAITFGGSTTNTSSKPTLTCVPAPAKSSDAGTGGNSYAGGESTSGSNEDSDSQYC